jgi:hypothetical protein
MRHVRSTHHGRLAAQPKAIHVDLLRPSRKSAACRLYAFRPVRRPLCGRPRMFSCRPPGTERTLMGSTC